MPRIPSAFQATSDSLRRLKRPLELLSSTLVALVALGACSHGSSTQFDAGGAGSNTSGSPGAAGAVGGAGASGSAAGLGGTGGGAGAPAGGAGGTPSTAGNAGSAGGSPSGPGAPLPFVEYEAEALSTNGEQRGPDRKRDENTSPEAEASGRKLVRLAKGQYVELTNLSAANSLVVRYSIADNTQGSLAVTVNDEPRSSLQLSADYIWTYGNEAVATGDQAAQSNPASGLPHHYFDEARALIGDVPAPARVRLTNAGSGYVDVDLLDLELAPAPLAKPAGFRDITDCGATPASVNATDDDYPAIQKCLDEIGTTWAGIYIPAGVFHLRSLGGDGTGDMLSVKHDVVAGAGVWYSELRGRSAEFRCGEGSCQFRDFFIYGEIAWRDSTAGGERGFSGGNLNDVVIENVWVEHTRSGLWATGANHITVRSVRIRNTTADGVNFSQGTSNSTVERSHFRNTGDDSLASWSRNDRPVNTNNVFRNNTIQLPWKAQCFGIYGGSGIRVQDNLCADSVQGAGIIISSGFQAHPLTDLRLERNSVSRCGGFIFDRMHGAIEIDAYNGPLANFSFEGLRLTDPTDSSIRLTGSGSAAPADFSNCTFSKVQMSGDMTSSFDLHELDGSCAADHVVVSPARPIAAANATLNFVRGDGNEGW